MTSQPSTPFQTRVERDVVEAVGPDAATFLQGQLSQDVASLAEGAGAYSLLLQPQGKVDAWLRVTRLGAERFLLDVDAGYGAAVVARLSRFKLRTRCELAVLEGWACWAVFGLDPADAAAAAAESSPAVGEVRVPRPWPSAAGFDRLGPAADLRPLDGVAVVDVEHYHAARIDAGVPAMGAELDADTIPAEAGRWLIDVSVSFTKGCYTGQELVARVDSRGSNTPRKLRHVTVADGPTPVAGTTLELDGAEVGTVTSSVPGHTVALAYLKRSVEPPAAVRAGGLTATVAALPEG